jgi:hypothetical protein
MELDNFSLMNKFFNNKRMRSLQCKICCREWDKFVTRPFRSTSSNSNKLDIASKKGKKTIQIGRAIPFLKLSKYKRGRLNNPPFFSNPQYSL